MQTLNAQAKAEALAAPLATTGAILAAMSKYREQWPDLFTGNQRDLARDLAEYTYADIEPRRHLFQPETPERYYTVATRFVYGFTDESVS